MSEPDTEGEGGTRSRLSRTAALAGIALIVVAAIGVALVFRFVAGERERDLRVWQISLGIIADTRAAEVDAWIERQFATVRGLAANESLQLYMTEITLAAGKPGDVTEEPAQAGYLRNLLVATAERDGFTVQRRSTPVNANVVRVGLAGLALLDHDGKLLVATPEMPPIEGRIKEFLIRRKPGERALLDLYLNAEGVPTMGFLAPIFAMQTDASSAQEIGVVLGIRPVADELYARLKQPGDVSQTTETDLVRHVGATIEYLSPLADGTPPLKRALAADTPELADAFAMNTPGGFAERTDYAGKRVLVTGRTLSAAPWTIVRKVDASEALAETNYRSRVLLAIFLGAILLVAVLLVAVWRHATSIRANEAASRYRTIAERFSKLSHFLRVVTDGQPTAIAAVDAAGHYTFANKGAAAGLAVSSDDLIGKSMASVLGPARARTYEDLNRRAMAEAKTVSGTQTVGESGAERILRSQHIPLPDADAHAGGVLMVTEDITDLVQERARRERTQKQLVATLVALIDRRDPFASNHSARVAEVARAVAEEMHLPPVAIETAEIAASLMNLGKIAVPQDLLTRTGELRQDEIRLIRESILTSADLLDGIEFDGPVVETLRQLQENWDGSGMPKGLKGEDILPMARVVAVANAFVGMVSARAYRPGLPLDAAARMLLEAAGAKFDRRPIAALMNILDNRDGRTRWASFAEVPSAPRG